MAETFGEVLRSLRDAAGMSLSALAARTHYSKSVLAYVETGQRTPYPDLVAACDEALGTAPLLGVLRDMDEQGDSVKRRALLTGLTGAASVAGLVGVGALADIVRHGLLDAANEGDDWDAVVGDYTRRLVTDPSPVYGQALLAQLMVARQQLVDQASADRLRAVAQLGQLYGLWLGNQGNVPTARGWYRTAATLAGRSGDSATHAYVVARAASRGIYEGYTVAETIDSADHALALSPKPSTGAVEAYSALVHVHALTGNLTEGRKAVAGMAAAAEHLPEQVAGPVQRTVSFRNYLECRVGPVKAATLAHDAALTSLRSVPVWLADAKVYYGMALVRSGDTAGGISYALTAVKGLSHNVRVVAVGVSDLLGALPGGYRSDEADELAGYAAAGPGPWETIA